jgi:hypothetical protein
LSIFQAFIAGHPSLFCGPIDPFYAISLGFQVNWWIFIIVALFPLVLG